LIEFVNGLDISDAAKNRLIVLRPSTYTGLAQELAERFGE
jgi:adenylosuccinate lyase